mmetsp:Transcript_41814/g.110725  ORF Transcript_41814/g.110725 Transcript_41814/m.110725 type:complete len:147 (+) Transcript_41814:2982-3422(+)
MRISDLRTSDLRRSIRLMCCNVHPAAPANSWSRDSRENITCGPLGAFDILAQTSARETQQRRRSRTKLNSLRCVPPGCQGKSCGEGSSTTRHEASCAEGRAEQVEQSTEANREPPEYRDTSEPMVAMSCGLSRTSFGGHAYRQKKN